MQTSDLGSIEVHLNRDTELEGAEFVEVIGKVADSGEVLREFTSVNLGSGVGESPYRPAMKERGADLLTQHLFSLPQI